MSYTSAVGGVWNRASKLSYFFTIECTEYGVRSTYLQIRRRTKYRVWSTLYSTRNQHYLTSSEYVPHHPTQLPAVRRCVGLDPGTIIRAHRTNHPATPDCFHSLTFLVGRRLAWLERFLAFLQAPEFLCIVGVLRS